MSQTLITPTRGRPKGGGPSRIARAFEVLRSEVIEGKLSPGDPLPSQRVLGEQYQMSSSSAGAVLARLAQEGLVVRTPGRGTFVAPKQRHQQNKVIAIVRQCASKSKPTRHEPIQLIDAFARSCDIHGYEAVWHHLPYETLIQPARLLARFQNVKAVLGLKVPDLFLNTLQDNGIMVVAAVLRAQASSQLCPFPQFDFDRREVMRMAVDHLVKLGYRRLAFVGRDLTHERAAGFVDAVQHHRLAMPVDWLLFNKDYYLRDVRTRLKAILTNSDRPQAVCCETDHVGGIVESVAMDLALRVPEDLAIVAGDDGGQGAIAPVPLTAVSFDIENACNQILGFVDQMIQRSKDPTPQHFPTTMLPLRLTVRESCGGKPTDDFPETDLKDGSEHENEAARSKSVLNIDPLSKGR